MSIIWDYSGPTLMIFGAGWTIAHWPNLVVGILAIVVLVLASKSFIKTYRTRRRAKLIRKGRRSIF